MVDYEELYYASQRKLTKTIQILEQELSTLKQFQCCCEERILQADLELTRNHNFQSISDGFSKHSPHSSK